MSAKEFDCLIINTISKVISLEYHSLQKVEYIAWENGRLENLLRRDF